MTRKTLSPIVINGKTYSAEPLHSVIEPACDPLITRGLDSVVSYVKNEIDVADFKVIHVSGEGYVDVYSELNSDNRREHYLQCRYPELSFRFGHFMPYHEFIIALQSMFVYDANVDQLLKYVGNIREVSSAEFKDDGVSQTVVCKTGIAWLENVVLPSRIVLRPYRTFFEVEQPASEFVFRIGKNSDCALFEADGGAWKREAFQNIKDYLVQNLTDSESYIIL